MISIALDAFGGDFAPDVVVQGAINAVNSSEGKFAIVLCGPEAEVKAKLKKAIGDSSKLDFSRNGKYTVGQWMDLRFENYAKLKVRPSSHQTYEGYIRNHIKPNIGDIPIEKLSSL